MNAQHVAVEHTTPATPAPWYTALEPELLTTRDGFMDFVHRKFKAPDLKDCAPRGTEVTDTDVRMIYSGEMMTISTPDVTRGLKTSRRTLRTNRFRPTGKRMNLVIDGVAGKSTLLLQIGRAFQGLMETERPPDKEWTPVVYINVPPRQESNLDWSLPFADFFKIDHTIRADTRSYRSTDMTEPVFHIMRESRTSLILIDGIDRIHDSDLAGAFDYFDCLQARLRVSLIFCGRGATDIVHEGIHSRRRSERPRSSEQYDSTLPVMQIRPIPFSKGAENAGWRDVLMAYDDNLRLYDHRPGSLLEFEAYLHERTGGYMDTLSQLICQTAQDAIETGTEAITKDALDDMCVGRNDPYDD